MAWDQLLQRLDKLPQCRDLGDQGVDLRLEAGRGSARRSGGVVLRQERGVRGQPKADARLLPAPPQSPLQGRGAAGRLTRPRVHVHHNGDRLVTPQEDSTTEANLTT